MPHLSSRSPCLLISPNRRGGAAVLLLAVTLASTCAWAADRALPLRELLQSIARSGVQLIYSSETIPPDLQATPPPADLPVEARLKQLLAPLHLEAQKLPAGGYVIVRSPDLTATLEVSVSIEREGVVTPLAGAEVMLMTTPHHALTNSSGRATFADLPPADYSVAVRSDGLRMIRRTVHLAPGNGATHIEMRVQWEPLSLEEIKIESSRYDAGATLGLPVTRETLESIPTTSSDAARALQLLPGAAVAGYSAKTHVRGSRDDETLYRYDGLTLTDPFHLESFQSVLSVIDPAVMESATTWTGVAPIQFASHIGAAIDIDPRVITGRTIDAKLSNRDLGVLLGTPFDDARGTVFVAGRFSNLHSPARWLEPESFSPEFRDYVLRATFQVWPRTRLMAGAFVTDDLRDTLSSETEPADQRARFHANERYQWLRLVQELLPWVNSETLVSQEFAEERVAGRTKLPNIELGFLTKRTRDSALTLREALTLVPTPQWSLQIGAERTATNVEDTLASRVTFSPPFVPLLQPTAPGLQDSDIVLHAVANSLYAGLQWRRSDRTLADVGVRRDSRQFGAVALGDTHWSARANLRQRLSAATLVRLGWGQTTQASVFDVSRAADGTVRPEPARLLTQVNLSVEQVLDRHWFLRTELYDKREHSALMTHEDVFTPFALLPEIALGNQLIETQGARMRGIEIQLESDRTRPFSSWLSYTRSKAEDCINGQWVLRSWDQPNAAQLGVRWRQDPWRLTGLLSWHSGWPYTPLVVSNSTWQDPSLVSVSLAARNSARLQNYISLDWRLTWEHDLAGGAFQASLELNNVTNSKSICCQNYSVTRSADGSSKLIDTPGYWLSFSPTLVIRWRH